MRRLNQVFGPTLLSVLLGSNLLLAAEPADQDDGADRPEVEARKKKKYNRRPIDISLVHPINIFHPPNKVIAGFSLNIVYGRTTKLIGFELGFVVNHELEDVKGVQIAGGVNYVGRNASAFQIAGLATVVGKHFKGAQLSGVLNWAKKDSLGLMVAAGINSAGGHYKGVQMSGLMNFVTGNLFGYQLSALLNYGREVVGLQFGGVLNGARKIKGVQFGFVMNIATQQLTGLQFGLVNYAKKVRGVQIGIINLCDDLRGVQLGGLNIARKNVVPVMILVNAGF